MKAPDKIYIYREPPKDYFEDEWGESEVNDMDSIPYIRKEALLEWLEEKSKEYHKRSDEGELVLQQAWAFDELINHIESL